MRYETTGKPGMIFPPKMVAMPKMDNSWSVDPALHCAWQPLKEQLLLQWNRINKNELEAVGPNRHEIATLIQRKYGISQSLVENYLTNFERTLPIM